MNKRVNVLLSNLRTTVENYMLGDDTPVDLVSNVAEGRLTYIADMADQLSLLAAAGGEERLARSLDSSALMARDAVAGSRKKHDNTNKR